MKIIGAVAFALIGIVYILVGMPDSQDCFIIATILFLMSGAWIYDYWKHGP